MGSLAYEIGGQRFEERDPVILAFGGFGTDFTKDPLLAQYWLDLMHLLTTNGERCTDDGSRWGRRLEPGPSLLNGYWSITRA